MNAYTAPGVLICPGEIQRAAARAWDLNPSLITKHTRQREIVEPRQVVFYYRYKILNHGPSKIQIDFPGFSHCTILHAAKVVPNYVKWDKRFKTNYETFLEYLK